MAATDFVRKDSVWGLATKYVRWRLFRWMTRRAAPLFVRGGDLTSASPQIFGAHEPIVTEFLNFCAGDGYSDFLIDIGANVGLIACQCGRRFQQVAMFEPNPLCRAILATNAQLTFEKGSYELYPFALGTQDGSQILVVPKANWGGAFIDDEHNAYGDELVIRKPGFDPDLFITVEIEVREAVGALRHVLEALRTGGARRGVIKLDVEGYEPVVLGALAKALPVDVGVVILFECLSEKFDMDGIVSAFAGRARLLRLAHLVSGRENVGSALKAVFLRGGLTSRLEMPSRAHPQGDFVLVIEPQVTPPV